MWPGGDPIGTPFESTQHPAGTPSDVERRVSVRNADRVGFVTLGPTGYPAVDYGLEDMSGARRVECSPCPGKDSVLVVGAVCTSMRPALHE